MGYQKISCVPALMIQEKEHTLIVTKCNLDKVKLESMWSAVCFVTACVMVSGGAIIFESNNI